MDMLVKILLTLSLFMRGSVLSAQTSMRIHQKGGGHSDVPIEQIDSVTFVDGETIPVEAELTGSWLWGDVEAGYYELLTFNSDNTYTAYDNYFTYGFDTTTYGWYIRHGALLTLQSNGFGYKRKYNWFIMGLAENALEVMTKMGTFIYYRIQSETIHLQAMGEPLTCDSGDTFVFADGVLAKISDGKLYGLLNGTTYIQKYDVKSNSIVSYRVFIE